MTRGIRRRDLPSDIGDYDHDLIERLQDAGWLSSDIAEEVDQDRRVVAKRLRAMGYDDMIASGRSPQQGLAAQIWRMDPDDPDGGETA